MKQSPYQLLMGVVLLGTVAFLSWQAGGLAAAGMQYIQSENGPGEQKQAVVVIDPGHGGTDPGKVGIDGQLEKDINLAVAKKLKTYLEASDVPAGKPAADLRIEPIQPSDDHVQARGLFVRIVRPGELRRHHVMRVNLHHEIIAAFVRAV